MSFDVSIRLRILFLTAQLVIVDSALMSDSSSSAVVIDSTATFSCATADKTAIRWNQYLSNSTDVFRIYTGNKLHPNISSRYHVEVNQSTGANTLTISGVQPNDSGSYECLELRTSQQKITFELVVLVSAPTCAATLRTKDEIEVSCTAVFSGNAVPVTTCIPGTAAQVTVSHGPLRTATYRSTTHYKEGVDASKMRIMCQTSIPGIPSYTNAWTPEIVDKTISHLLRETTQQPLSEESGSVLTNSGLQLTVIVVSLTVLFVVCLIIVAFVVVGRRRGSVRRQRASVSLSEASSSTRTYVRPGRGTVRTVVHDEGPQQVYNRTEQYGEEEMAIQTLNGSSLSIDRYSEISQKSRHEDGKDSSYESLDQKSIAEIVARQPDIYDDLDNIELPDA